MEERSISMWAEISVNGTEKQIESILTGDSSVCTVWDLIKNQKFSFEGNIIIPEHVIEEYNNEYGTNHEVMEYEL